MVAKILIANRGEIACRIMRTARRMGIATVAVYSDADAEAVHTRMADQAIAIGPAPAAESYLDVEALIAAVRGSGADAVHPGYGFLSENAEFVRRLEREGIVFIGPGAEAVAAMGDKIAARRIARAAGVPVVPGSEADLSDPAQAIEAATEIGFPLMVKAASGGGGKGLRRVDDGATLADALRGAAAEAAQSFADGRVFLERYIRRPRHIEVQVLADAHGRVIHLGERECSIQRRHQKVIEEAPSPTIDERLRAAICTQAVALAAAVGYRSAGTVEFIVDENDVFYFLEMNTRLQVEHPVTELVTGIDLVEQMIRIARGEPLGLTQEQMRTQGAAIECRLYAEDPRHGFLPATGRLVRYRLPPAAAGVRIDDGVAEGSEITAFYDGMMAKLCTHGATREDARLHMLDVLARLEVRGLATNADFLARIVEHEHFRDADLSTDFIDTAFPEGFRDDGPAAWARPFLIGATLLIERDRRRRLHAAADAPLVWPERWVVMLNDVGHEVVLRADGAAWRMGVDGEEVRLRGHWRAAAPWVDVHVEGESRRVQVATADGGWRMGLGGVRVNTCARTSEVAALARLMPPARPAETWRRLLSPMPGRIVSVAVSEGEQVLPGAALVVVDAMKMENVLRAERGGLVARVAVAQGDAVSAGTLLIEFATEEPAREP